MGSNPTASAIARRVLVEAVFFVPYILCVCYMTYVAVLDYRVPNPSAQIEGEIARPLCHGQVFKLTYTKDLGGVNMNVICAAGEFRIRLPVDHLEDE